MTAAMALPTGRRGQALAVALTAAVLGLAWLGGVAPALDWFSDRAEHLAEQQALAARMQSVAAMAPALQRQLAQAEAVAPAQSAVIQGGTDAIAGAALQGAVQDIATAAGATVASAELLPTETVGAYRRINLRMTVNGSWPVITAMLRGLAEASPRMLVDDLALRQPLALGQGSPRVEAAFTVIAFSTAAAPVAGR